MKANRLLREKKVWNKRGSLALGPVEMAGYYEWGKALEAETIDMMADDIVHELCIKQEDRFLEVGCGNGLFLSRIAKQTKDVTGVDFSSRMLSHAKELCDSTTLLRAEAGSLPFEDNSFDKVLCNGVFHHFPSYEYAERALQELIRVCRAEGRILIAGLPEPEEEDLQNSLILHRDRGLFGNIRVLLKWYIREKLGRQSRFIFFPRDFFPSRLPGYNVKVETEKSVGHKVFPRFNVLIADVKKA